jgi:Flp pilus assembly protein TadG
MQGFETGSGRSGICIPRSPVRSGPRRQRGVAAIEFALVFSLFFAVFYAIVAFGMVLVSKQLMTLAAEEGARASLRYPGSCATAEACLQKRIDAATAAATAAMSWLPGSAGSPPVTVGAAPCSYDGTSTCVTVDIVYHYSEHPIIPSLPGFGVILPDDLSSKAVMQLGSI